MTIKIQCAHQALLMKVHLIVASQCVSFVLVSSTHRYVFFGGDVRAASTVVNAYSVKQQKYTILCNRMFHSHCISYSMRG